MIFRSATLKGCFIPEFKLKGVTLHVVAIHINILETIFQMNFQMMMILIDDDINRQRSTLCVQGNIILRNFSVT